MWENVFNVFIEHYIPSRGTVIGALETSFKVSVGELADKKEGDYTNKHHCWWSSHLPDNVPYRYVLSSQLCDYISKFYSI